MLRVLAVESKVKGSKMQCIGELLASHVKPWRPASLRAMDTFAKHRALDLPVRVGGGGLSLREMVDQYRAAGGNDVEVRDMIGAGHGRLLLTAPSSRHGSLIDGLISGKVYMGVAITEPNVGSDLFGIETTAEQTATGFVLNGTKQHVARLLEATHFAVLARVCGSSQLTFFCVPSRQKGAIDVSPATSVGLTNMSWGRITFNNLHIDQGALIGGIGQGLSIFKRHFSYWRIAMAAVAIGAGETVLSLALARLRQRSAFGGAIGRFSHFQQDAARIAAALRMCKLLVEDIADRFDRRVATDADAAMAKAEALSIALEASQWAMAIFGAAAYDSDSRISKLNRDLTGLAIADGTTSVLRAQVAKELLGREIYDLGLGRGAPK